MTKVPYAWSWFIEWQTPYEFHAHEVDSVLLEVKTKFQEVKLVNLRRFGKALIIDGKTQSTVSDEFIYHESLVHPLLLSVSNPQKVLIIGGGEGATLREVLRHKTVKRAVMVDIDEAVIQIAKQMMPEWHHAFDDARPQLIIGDGLKFIEETQENFDAIILDLTDPMKDSPSYKLYTREFYSSLKRVLREGGALVTQSTSPSFSLETFSVIFNTLRNTFRYASAVVSYVPAFDGLWGFSYASDRTVVGEMGQSEVDSKLEETVKGELKYYDGRTHLAMFNIPKYIRDFVKRERRISTEADPIYVPA